MGTENLKQLIKEYGGEDTNMLYRELSSLEERVREAEEVERMLKHVFTISLHPSDYSHIDYLHTDGGGYWRVMVKGDFQTMDSLHSALRSLTDKQQ